MLYNNWVLTPVGVPCRMVPSRMEHLNRLRDELQQINSHLSFPLTLAERHQMYERRQEILTEARELALSLNIAGDHWFNNE
jgi:hypothetical protein